MMKIKTLVAVGAAMTLAVMSGNSFAQDDLDDLLKDLEGDAVAEATVPADEADEAEPEETEAEAPEATLAPDAEEPAEEADAATEEEPAAEADAEEPAEVADAEEPVEEADAEEPAEVADAEEPVEEADAEEPAAEAEAPEAEEAEEEPAEEVADAEEPTDEAAAEEPAEEVADAEEPTDEAAAEEPAAEPTEATPEATPTPASDAIPAPVADEEVEEEVDNVISLLNELSAEVDAKTAPAAEATVAAEPAPAAPAEKTAVDPKAELIASVRATERIRVEALEIQAKRTMKEAQTAMKAGDYSEAVRQYTLAYKWLGDRPTNRDLKKICEHGIAEGLYRQAVEHYDLGRHETAKTIMQEAVKMRHPKAAKTLEKWLRTDEESFRKPDLSEITHVRNDAKYKTERANIRKHLKRSRQYLAVKDIDKALEECELVIVNDPYNQEALKLRSQIIKKKAAILQQERDVARDGMIADVDRVWRPLYAPNATQLDFAPAETQKVQVGEDPERTMEQDVEKRMKEMRLPTISFKPPATIIDAIDFFRQASKDYDRPDIPIEKRGFNFVLKTPEQVQAAVATSSEDSDDFSSTDNEEEVGPSVTGVPVIPTITASDITFYEALKLVTDQVGYKFRLRGSIIMIMPKTMSIDELLTRNYNVPDSLSERVTSASSDIKEMKSSGFGGGSSKSSGDDEENQERDWKDTFKQLGVDWPEGSSIMYIKSLGKLRVRNTSENLALMEQALSELGGVVKLIEIETRFVEVSQEDLNSLGFEWILNNDMNIGLNDKLGKALGVRKGGYASNSSTTTTGGNVVNNQGSVVTSPTTSSTVGGAGTSFKPGDSGLKHSRNLGLEAMGGSSDYANGNRYLSQTGNHVSGQGMANNDQFMRVNAFLGSADLSMILHMLSQRSDTDLLSAPKVVTKSGTEATIKVVTEYIYPTDYNVQLQSSSSSSGNNGGSQSAILAIVEPENFQTRPVGVILTVTPTYTETNGGLIDLELNPQVVDEPTWKNYGMKIPYSGNSSLQNFEGIGGIFDGLSSIFSTLGESIPNSIKAALGEKAMDSATSALDGLTRSNMDNMTYYDAPMEQPFFHVREVSTSVSINPGSTVVLGGLITEQRKAMDDKVPFLGDLPFVGRLFRSHAEKTVKRNLLIFVTGRLITPSGREVRTNDAVDTLTDDEVKAAPSVE